MEAEKLFKKGYSCSQAVLAAYGDQLGLDKEVALKLGAGFGGGMGGMALTCGAVTGSILVIGMKYGHTKARDKNAKQKTQELVREFTENFQAKNGSISCKELMGCDISTVEGLKKAKRSNLIRNKCTFFVTDAVNILNELFEK